MRLNSKTSLLSRAKRRLLHWLGLSTDPVLVLKRHSGLVDAQWYLEQYPDVAADGVSPVRHYALSGWSEGRNPNAFFDTNWYLAQYTDVRDAGLNPLAHYVIAGSKEGRSPFDGFDGAAYRARHPGFDAEGQTALEHFLAGPEYEEWKAAGGFGERFAEALRGSPLFQAAWYRGKYPDIPADMDAVDHYVKLGSIEGRKPNPYFDPAYYLAANPEVKPRLTSPLHHYMTQGWRAMRSPSREFSLERYAALTGWSPDEGVEPLARFLSAPFHGIAPVDLDKPDRVIHLGDAEAGPFLSGSVLRYPVDYPAAEPVTRGSYRPDRLNVHWVLPDFGVGGGGHMTIFRMIREMSLRGHRQVVWLHGPGQHSTGEAAFEDVVRFYQTLDAEVRRLGEGEVPEGEADVVVATDWASVWPARAMRGAKRCFYLVQDYEPLFYPRGSEALLAESTYRMDVDCLCASPWLAETMAKTYGRWSRSFHLAADRDIYYPPVGDAARSASASLPRIAFYARNYTPRRAIDLGLLALEALADQGHRFIVDIFGGNFTLATSRFPFVQHGVMNPHELAALYREATVGMVFSATNYSLVPQEMMACGLPLVELDVDSTQAIYPDDVAMRAAPDPIAIADALKTLLLDPDRRRTQRTAALEWVSRFSWQGAADVIETGIRDRLAELGHTARPPMPRSVTPKISVAIPALNGGPLLLRIIEKLKSQQLRERFEILVIDSGSSDGTPERLEADPDVILHRIEKKDFGHGRTRNLAVELTSGEYVAFLTQDAMPLDDQWLANYVMMLDHFPDAGGAIGPHLAWPEASAFVKRDLEHHFRGIESFPLLVSRGLDEERYRRGDAQWRQILHFYSDNNSCLRRSAWRTFPYRDVKFGEDQLYAADIVEGGHGRLFIPSAKVYHSHDYDEAETFERAKEESEFFVTHFGYVLIRDEDELRDTLDRLDKSDLAWGRAHGLDSAEIDRRLLLNAARLRGYLAGRRSAEELGASARAGKRRAG